MAGVFDFGIRLPKDAPHPTEQWTYHKIDSGFLGVHEYGVSSYPRIGWAKGDYTWVGAFNTTAGFFVSRVEWWSGSPLSSGTLLAADDFNVDPYSNGWTAHRGGYASWSGGVVRINGGGFSQAIYKLTPVGATTCLLRGCYFGVEDNVDSWGMVGLHSPTGTDYGEQSARVLARPTTHPHYPEAAFDSTSPPPAETVTPLLRQRQVAL